MNKIENTEIVIIGAGIVGISTAYYLCKKYQCSSILLIDERDPMSYTTAQSGDNYRNWWPSEVMTQFTNFSIDLMRDIAYESSNSLAMKQRGYAITTRQKDISHFIESLGSNYRGDDNLVRVHNSADTTSYSTPHSQNWDCSLDGVDILSNRSLIKNTFPAFNSDIEHVLHIRRAGDFSSQQMGQFMLEQIKPLGCDRLRGRVTSIQHGNDYTLEVQTQEGTVKVNAAKVVNAAGPYVAEIAKMLSIELPVENIFHQKLAFEDINSAVPRNQPFSIDIDETSLDWSDEERAALAKDDNLKWLTQPITGGIHCRPEGKGKWIKLGWAYNRQVSQPDPRKVLTEDAMFNPSYPEIVLRGASKLNSKLGQYIESLPANRVHYGGYYTMTKENWPLIGPLDQSGAFVVGALSGFGCMAACGAGSIAADWVCEGQPPSFSEALSLQRYNNPSLKETMEQPEDIGLL